MSAITLDVMLGTYPHTQALKSGEIRSERLALNVADVASASTAFRRVVGLEFDVAELSVVTFLIAKSHGVPLVLLPADLFRRAKPPELLYDASKGVRGPRHLAGARIGVAYYSATTTVWMQHMLAEAGVDTGNLQWIAAEGPHVAAYRDPSTVMRAPADKPLRDLLLSGEVDAIVSTSPPGDPRFQAISFKEPSRLPAMQSHHMVVVKQTLTREHPDAVRELWRMLLAAKSTAHKPGDADPLPFGLAANFDHLASVIGICFQLGYIPEKIPVESLFDDVTAGLPSAM